MAVKFYGRVGRHVGGSQAPASTRWCICTYTAEWLCVESVDSEEKQCTNVLSGWRKTRGFCHICWKYDCLSMVEFLLYLHFDSG